MLRRLFLAFLGLLLVGMTAIAHGQSTISLAADTTRIDLGAATVSFLRDPGGTLDIAAIRQPEQHARFQPLADGLRLGYTRDVIWLRFTVQRSTDAPVDWRLGIDTPAINDLRFFAPEEYGNTVFQAGDRYSFIERALPYRFPLFPVSLTDDRTHTYHVRIETDSVITAPLILWRLDAFRSAAQEELMLTGAHFGIVLILGLYAFVNWIGNRSRQLLQFVVATPILLATMSAWHGLLAPYVFPNTPHLADLATPYLTGLYAATVLFILRHILDTRHTYPRLDRIIILLTGLCLLAPLSREIGLYRIAGLVIHLAAITGLLLQLFIAMRHWQSGHPGAGLLLAGVAAFVLTSLSGILVNLKLLPLHPFLLSRWQPGMVLFLLLSQLGVLAQLRSAQQRHRQAQLLNQRSTALAVQAERLREEQTVFFSFVAHELRSPLGVIRTSLANLERELPADTDRFKPRLDRLQRSTARMADLIERHLQLQRLADPGFTLRRGPEAPLAPLDAALVQAHELFPHRHFDCAVPPAPTFPASVRMDAELIELALLNLLTNAAKYSPLDRSVLAEITVEHGCLVYRITDYGPGIPADELPRLFSIYQRKDADQAGFGIGLTLAQRIASLHGGKLDYQREDETTVFALSIPLSSCPSPS